MHSTSSTLADEHIDTLRATLPLVTENLNEISKQFYQQLFAAHPELARDTFNRENQDDERQPRALAAAITHFAKTVVDGVAPPLMQLDRIAGKHVSLGVSPAQYAVVYEHLFGAIRTVLGEDTVTEPVAHAWRHLYWAMADELIGRETSIYERLGLQPGEIFCPAAVLARAQIRHDLTEFTVSSADPDRVLPNLLPGQSISVAVILPDGARQPRQYRVVACRPGVLTFLVKEVATTTAPHAGEVSRHLVDNVTVGAYLAVSVHPTT